MGLVCRHISFRTNNQRSVAKTLSEGVAGIDAFPGPAQNGWVTVFDADLDEAREAQVGMEKLASIVCPRVDCAALGLEFYRYWFFYWVFDRSGKLVDSSTATGDPHTTDDGRGLAGKLDCLVEHLDLQVTSADIRTTLSKPEALLMYNYLSFAELLGIRNASRSYRQLFALCDTFTEDLVPGWNQFVHVGSPDPRGW
jgi:hypothetical protein